MARGQRLTRRSVLAVVGGTVLLGGTASGQSDRGRLRRPKVTGVGRGIVIVHDGCDRARIYGRDRTVSHVVLSFHWDDDGIPGTGRYEIDDPTFALRIDAADTPYGGLGASMTVSVVDEDGQVLVTGSAPDRCDPAVE